jgi:hypothetical protein
MKPDICPTWPHALPFLLGLAWQAAAAQPTTPAVSDPERSVVVPALEIIGFDLILSTFNRRFSGSTDYDVSLGSIRRNLRGPWVVDNDPFSINQFAHPYQGSLYHGAGRAAGLGYWEAAALTFAGSAWWEITGEKTPPSRNDQIASGIAGSFLGEPLFRMAHLVLKDRSGLPTAWREGLAAIVSPGVGLNRLMFGSHFGGVFSDNEPSFYGRLRIGATHAVQHSFDTPLDFKANGTTIDFAIDYGLPGQPGYTYRRPFDYFTTRVMVSSANGIEGLSTTGLIYGSDYAVGPSYRGIWGLYGSYDYLAPQIFHVSTTSLSLGTTGQWWATQSIAVQGTVLAGLGYAAASSMHRTADERDYHYGAAPRFAIGLRGIVGADFSADMLARMVSLGSIDQRNAGRDEIANVDTALTWRIQGRHAVGVNYAWSHRSTSSPDVSGRRQTLGRVGLFYTLVAPEVSGAVDWRPPAAD